MFCDISVEAEMAIRKSLTTAGAGVLGGAVGLALLGTTCSASVLDYTGFTVTGDSITIDTPLLTSGVAGLIHLITPSGTVDDWCLDMTRCRGQGPITSVRCTPRCRAFPS
jgi:hypothetical protein